MTGSDWHHDQTHDQPHEQLHDWPHDLPHNWSPDEDPDHDQDYDYDHEKNVSSKLWCQGSFTLLRCFVLFVCLLHLSFCQYDAFVCQNFIIHSWWSVKFLRGSWGVSSLHVTHFLMFVWCICLFAKILYHFPGGQVRWCVSSLSATHCCACLFVCFCICSFVCFIHLFVCVPTLYITFLVVRIFVGASADGCQPYPQPRLPSPIASL